MPTIGYKVNDWLSIGAGARVQYFKVRYFSAIGPTLANPSPFAASAGLDGDDFGFGYSVGATLTPFAGTSIGIGYRSAVEQDLDGAFPVFRRADHARSSMLPESISVGMSQRVGRVPHPQRHRRMDQLEPPRVPAASRTA